MTTLEQARAAIILNTDKFRKDFFQWATNNIAIIQYFDSQVFALIRAGCKRVGAKMIIENIRYRTALREVGTEGWKVNNSFTADLARLHMLCYPEHKGIFEIRNNDKPFRDV